MQNLNKNNYNYHYDKKENYRHKSTYTNFLIFLLIFIFAIQVFYLNSNEDLMNVLKTHTNHLFEGNYFSIFTSIFLHANPIHLISNLLALFIFGRIVERNLGAMILVLFIGSGIISNILSNLISYYLNDVYYSLGASGAIAGLIIFAILLEPFKIAALLFPIPIFILGWFLIYIDIIGITNPSSINHLAHISGYASLLFLFFFLEIHHKKRIMKGFFINFVLLSILALIMLLFPYFI